MGEHMIRSRHHRRDSMGGHAAEQQSYSKREPEQRI
jgi:hypothetical protein